MEKTDNETLRGVVNDRKVAIFLNEDRSLSMDVEAAGARELVVFGSDDGGVSSSVKHRSYRGLRDVRANNAEVIFLDGMSALAAKSRKFSYFRQARHLLVPVNTSGMLLSPLCFWHARQQRLLFRGHVRAGPLYWLHFENTNSRDVVGPAFFISIAGGAKEVFAPLSGLNYCVLRWHQLLGDIASLEDIDILVDNADIEEFTQRITRRLGFFRADIYTAFSVPGYSPREEAYFPPLRALDMLRRAGTGPFDERRPSPRDSLNAFSYHLLFQLKQIINPDPEAPLGKHTWYHERYYRELIRLAGEASVPPFETLDGMVSHLREEGWFPPEEMLKLIARFNPFIRDHYYAGRPVCRPGLAVFVMREVAQKYDLFAAIEAEIIRRGFEILRTGPIPDDLRLQVTAEFRGGNWSTPPTRSEPDGGPVSFIIAFDPHPIPVTNSKLRRRYPEGDNERLLHKTSICETVTVPIGRSDIIPFHSSDNSREALAYVRVLAPDLYDCCARCFGNGYL